MVFNRFHWTNIMATANNPAASIIGSCKPSFLAKTQSSALQSYAVSRFPCTSISGCDMFNTKRSLLQFKKVRGAAKMTTQQPKSIRCDLSNSFRELADESRKGSCICSLSMFGFSSHPLPSTSNFRISSKSVKPVYVAFSKRMYSTKARSGSNICRTETIDPAFLNGGIGNRNTPNPIVPNKHRKRVKAVPTQGSIESNPKNTFPVQVARKNVLDSRVSARKNVNIVNSVELLEDGQNENLAEALSVPSSADGKKVSKTETKQKQRSRNKKKKEESSNNLSSSGGVPSKGSKRVKKPNDLSPQTAECSSSVGITEKEVVLSVTPEVLPKKKTSKSKKEKPVKEDSEKKINGALPEPDIVVKGAPSILKSQQKPKPTTAKVIQNYLGDMYDVIPSYGHVRDLAARSGSVRPDDDFSMVWEVPSSAWTHLKSMKVAISGADNLILASDPDREGEAIAWHIIEMLQQQKALRKDITIARVVFQEITESAVKNALQSPRDINVNLVHAYLARRALDYLIGFNISPLLWRKLPGCQSAGRVQSAALSLLCDREIEIEEFKPQEYWSGSHIQRFKCSSKKVFSSSYLTHFILKS
ncbi:DNA topoisomerase 1 [Bienertia sinuspersici]